MLGGIENVYHDPCQDWLDLINKKLTSPNYSPFGDPRPNYDPRTVCQWNLTTDKGSYISLDFEEIGVSDEKNDLQCLNPLEDMVLPLNFIYSLPVKNKLFRKLETIYFHTEMYSIFFDSFICIIAGHFLMII